jgi:hypothetical protein
MEEIEVPIYIQENAQRGLRWYADGLGGDGLVDATIREARDLAEGRVTLDKVRRMSAWLARHASDLDAPAANPRHPQYPSPGVVASALWGGGTKRDAERAMTWANRVIKYVGKK